MTIEPTLMQPEVQDDRAKALVVPSTLRSLIEGLIFAAEEPLSIKQLKAIFEYSAPPGSGVEERKLDADSIRSIISGLNQEYAQADKPFRILQIAGGYQFATLKEYADWLGKLRREQARRKLSQSGIETLAIIAYKQPVTKAEIESIRGVNCDYVLKSLLEKELVTVTGRAETVGRPLLYGTTREFLKHFGLNEVTDLPRPREIEEILGETQFETERRMLEAQANVEKAKEDEDFKSRLPHIPKRQSGLASSSVEIVARSKRREVKTVQGPELPFVKPEQAVPAPLSGEVAPESQDGIAAGDETVIEPEHQDLTAQPSGESPTAPEVVVGSMAATEAPSEQAFTPVESTHLPSDGSLPDKSTTTQVEGNKNRWQMWKEKIQGYIRRLFD
ncbi:MAG: SMC-Scp complex subunit ScpB [Ignavibacteria bacterium GWA2_55_11]|nr:MAG: SMC-Scp complex subunit ScpB [Ignavibacteria bacterium GWA2_55_11]OGU76301.1 MAG: SMC-Scp complex subunit ScpB [Ignavibacteria bacterium RIFCSPLOWO2_12_FULL_56_21]